MGSNSSVPAHVQKARRQGDQAMLKAAAVRAKERRKEKANQEWARRIARLTLWVKDSNNYMLECWNRDVQAHLHICPVD